MFIQAILAIAFVNIYTVAWRKIIEKRLVLLTLSLIVIPYFCKSVQKPSLFLKYQIPRIVDQNELKQVLSLVVKELHPDKGGSQQQFSQFKHQSQQLQTDRLNYDIHGLREAQHLNQQYINGIQNKKILTFYAFVFVLFLAADANLSVLNFMLKSVINFSFFIYQSIQYQSDQVQTMPLDYVLTCWTIRQRRMVIHLFLIVVHIIALPSQEQPLKFPYLKKQQLSFQQYKLTALTVESRTSSSWYQKWLRVILVLGVLYIILNSQVKQGSGKSSFQQQTFGRFTNEMSQQQLEDYLDSAQ